MTALHILALVRNLARAAPPGGAADSADTDPPVMQGTCFAFLGRLCVLSCLVHVRCYVRNGVLANGWDLRLGVDADNCVCSRPAFVAAGEAMDEEGGGERINGLLCDE